MRLVEVWAVVSLVPVRVAEGDLRAEGLQGLGLALGRCLAHGLGLRRLDGDGAGCGLRLGGLGGLGLGVEGADEEFLLVLLEDALVVVFPELLGSVLSGYALEDLLTAWVVSVNMPPRIDFEGHELGRRTWVVILKCGQVVDVAVDNDVEIVGLVVRRNVSRGEGLGHGYG